MSEIDSELLGLFCDEVNDLLQQWELHCLELEKGGEQKTHALHALFRGAHNIKGSSRALGLTEMGNFVHKVEDGISLLRDDKIKVTSQRLKLLFQAQSLLSEWVHNLRSGQEAPSIDGFINSYLKAFQEGAEEAVTVPVAPPQKATIEEPASAREMSSDPPVAPLNLKKVAPLKTTPTRSADESIRVSTLKLDQLIQIIGELSIYQNIIHHNLGKISDDRELLETLSVSLNLTKEIYEKSLSLRMQPVTQLFQRLERAARDLARDINKNIEVELEGTECELDKGVLEKILDPLTHIVRNSIDHGIEKSEERKQQGKDERGKLVIRAVQENDGVRLIVADDGRGLHHEKIVKKAVEKGLIKADQNLSEAEINQLIFLPGFSTSETVTDVSGRGVGMDVVQKTLEELRGSLDVVSKSGKGTTISIKLPTSLSLIEATIIKVENDLYAVPSSDISEIIKTPKNSKDNLIELRGGVVPFIPITKYLAARNRSHESKSIALITKQKGHYFALGADEVYGQQQIVVRALDEKLGSAFGFAGGTILGTGEPALIIALEEIITQYMKNHSNHEGAAA